MSRTNVRVPVYKVTGVPTLTNMYLRLVCNDGNIRTSLEGQMRTLEDCEEPSYLPGIPTGVSRKVMIIGCEDKKLQTSGCDNDLNDVVFMIYGHPNIPGRHEVKEFPESKTVRYMIEDLGTTDDFDFNDVVVDVTAERTMYVDYVDGLPVEKTEKYSAWRNQTATVRALGGTLDFTLKVGSASWTKSSKYTATDMINTEGINFNEVLATFKADGWNPDQNNVSIEVNKAEGESTTSIGFPQDGDVPMIIATKPTQEWMLERHSIINTLKELILGK